MRRIRSLVVAAMAMLGAALPSQAEAPAVAAPPREGERCGAGRWLVEGGDVARNAASTNPPILHRPVIAWRQPLEGRLLGEPRVWDDRVVLAIDAGAKKRRIEVRRLADGGLVGRRDQNSTIDPAPSVWNNEVVWHPEPGVVELVRFDDRAVRYVRRSRVYKHVGPPLRFGNDVYAHVEGQLACLRIGDLRETWRSELGGYVGPVTVVGDAVIALRCISGEVYEVRQHDRNTGTLLGSSPEFRLRASPGDDLTMQAAGDTLVVRLGDAQMFANFKAPVPLNGVHFHLPLHAGQPVQPRSMPVRHALDATLHVQAVATQTGPQLGAFRNGSEEGVRLDACELHRAFGAVPPTLLGDVIYFGAVAVDRADYRLLWRLVDAERPLPQARAIPAGDSLLLADERELVALRIDAPQDPVGAELSAAFRAAQCTQLVPIVEAAIKTADWSLCDDLLARCRDLGVDEAWAGKQEQLITKGQKDTRRRVFADDAKRLDGEAAAVAGKALDELQRSVAGWATARPPQDYRRGLRFVLQHDPGQAAAVQAIKALLPAGLSTPEPFRGEEWLDFLTVVAHTPVAFVDARPEDFARGDLDPIAAQNEQQLLQWREQWRADLQAVQSARMLLFSPITAPGSLAKALATGELVCDALEQTFARMPPKRRDPRPMLVFIYPDRDEYLRESLKLGFTAAEWAAGYYAPGEAPAKSRMFVPDDASGFARVLPTLAHELTHQWLMDRCPAFAPNAGGALFRPRGFWIVEGFACLIEQFEFDFERRTSRLGEGNLEYADLVATIGEQLLPWDRFVRMSGVDFDRFAKGNKAEAVASRMHLGTSYQVTPLTLFYAQAAMLARYLYEADQGAHRQQLLDYVAAYYEGRAAQLAFDAAFGASADDLGKRVVAFAKTLLP